MRILLLFLLLAGNCQASALIGINVIPQYGYNCGTTTDAVAAAVGSANPKTWINTTGSAIYVKIVQLFMGMNGGVVADYDALVTRISDGSVVIHRGWDHYENPTGTDSGNPRDSFEPDWILINPGDGLKLVTWANAPGGNPFGGLAQASVSVSIWFTSGAP